jgi:hypothetical protein
MPDVQPPEPTIPQISTSNTKQEMLAAYKEVVKQLKERRETELKPQARLEEKQKEQAVQMADSLSTEGIAREVGNLRSEISKVLIELSDRMEEEIGKYLRLKKAVEAREKELKELSEIEKEALSLAALLEAQRDRRERFDNEMSEKKQSLEAELASTRAAWKEEQKAHEADVQAREAAEKKKREREAEEYTYAFERQKRLAQEQFEYEKASMERESQLRRQELERDLTTREQGLNAKEAELSQLRERVAASAAEQAAAVEKAVKETTERLTREADAREALLKKGFEGEEKVLQSRIESLQQTVKEQQQQIVRLSGQIDKSYGQVQEIAVKAIEGREGARASSVPQPPMTDK